MTAPAEAAQDSHWDRSVKALIAGTFLNTAAHLAGVTALGKLVFDLTGRELDLGLIGLAEFLPVLLLVLVAGSIADRVDRRLITGVGALVSAAVAAALAAYAASSPSAVAPIFALVVVIGIAAAFVSPASRALPADILAPEDLPWLVARHSATWQSALIVGPVLGGTLYAIDPAAPFVAVAVLYLLSALAYPLIRIRPRNSPAEAEMAAVIEEEGDEPARPGLHHALEGLRFIRQRPILLGAISLDLFAVLFGGAVALLPAITEDRLGVGAVGLGWLRAAGGIGAGAVTLVLTRKPVVRRIGRTLLTAVAVFGVATIALGLTRSYGVAFAAMLVLSGADAISVFIRATLVPLVVPQEMRGRVLAVENVFIGGSNELGAFESGVAGQILGPAGAVVLGGAATVAIAGTWALAFPALRDIDRFPGSGTPVERDVIILDELGP
ncbi:MAG TPA: MFS transporter [Acidimicrobiales bacterium]